MEALAERLSQLGGHADGAIRVIMFYDTLMRRRVDLAALVRASAGLAECTAGVRVHGTGQVIRRTPDGRELPPSAPSAQQSPTAAGRPLAPDAAPPASCTAPILLDDEEIGAVWLERPGATGPLGLDELLLERLAIAVAAVVERYGPARTTMADPALVELAIGPDSDEAARARALRLLGFHPDRPVLVAAVRSRLPLDRIGALVCPDRPVKAAALAGAGVLLATAIDADRFPADVRAGVGGADSPDRSWRQACTALRFTGPREPVVRFADLGARALLAEIPPDAVRADADVAAVARLAASPDELETLDVYCATGSLRRAAELLHLHHSSVARRLDRIGGTLGIDITTPTGLTRAGLALTAWRLLNA
ncbi:PucR family transcriptional regulator [Streptomyces sp. URMC 126]|uniref:PucR family transcriptional regulator n=1 Tax=Streptomyces sp. URMC 126 TaxID=3423401 RepID=UPI003F19613B